LTERFGKHGEMLHDFARGIDDRPVTVERERKSLSTETTYPADLRGLAVVAAEVEKLAAELAQGLSRRGLAACTITLKLRYGDFTTITRSRTLDLPTCDQRAIAACARDLLRAKTEAATRPVRLLGVGGSNLVQGEVGQLELWHTPC
jgi:DNA polymerase-4